MSPEFLRAVLDTLLPGLEPDASGGAVLPNGSAAGVVAAGDASHPVLAAIVAAAGGETAFVRAPEATRVGVLRQVEHDQPEAFRAMLTGLLSDYYQSPTVLAALGWSVEPPQPRGHELPPSDDEAYHRLERVRARSPLWRS